MLFFGFAVVVAPFSFYSLSLLPDADAESAVSTESSSLADVAAPSAVEETTEADRVFSSSSGGQGSDGVDVASLGGTRDFGPDYGYHANRGVAGGGNLAAGSSDAGGASGALRLASADTGGAPSTNEGGGTALSEGIAGALPLTGFKKGRGRASP